MESDLHQVISKRIQISALKKHIKKYFKAHISQRQVNLLLQFYIKNYKSQQNTTKCFSKLRKNELIDFYLKIKAVRKLQNWWLSLKCKNQTCMITLDPVKVPYWRQRLSNQKYAYYNLEAFVNYILSSGKFEDPASRKRLSDKDLKNIDIKQNLYFGKDISKKSDTYSVYYAKRHRGELYRREMIRQNDIVFYSENVREQVQCIVQKYSKTLKEEDSYLNRIQRENLKTITEQLGEIHELSAESCMQNLKSMHLKLFTSLIPKTKASCRAKDYLLRFTENSIYVFNKDVNSATSIITGLREYSGQNMYQHLWCICSKFEHDEQKKNKKRKSTSKKRQQKNCTKKKKQESNHHQTQTDFQTQTQTPTQTQSDSRPSISFCSEDEFEINGILCGFESSDI